MQYLPDHTQLIRALERRPVLYLPPGRLGELTRRVLELGDELTPSGELEVIREAENLVPLPSVGGSTSSQAQGVG